MRESRCIESMDDPAGENARGCCPSVPQCDDPSDTVSSMVILGQPALARHISYIHAHAISLGLASFPIVFVSHDSIFHPSSLLVRSSLVVHCESAFMESCGGVEIVSLRVSGTSTSPFEKQLVWQLARPQSLASQVCR